MSVLNLFVVSAGTPGVLRCYLDAAKTKPVFANPPAITADVAVSAANINAAEKTVSNVQSFVAIPVVSANQIVILSITPVAPVLADVVFSLDGADKPQMKLASSFVNEAYVAPMTQSTVAQAIAAAVAGAVQLGL